MSRIAVEFKAEAAFEDVNWPAWVAAVPRHDDMVRGNRTGPIHAEQPHAVLRVVSVTHTADGIEIELGRLETGKGYR